MTVVEDDPVFPSDWYVVAVTVYVPEELYVWVAGNQLLLCGEPSPQLHEIEVIEQLGPPGMVTPLTVALKPLTLVGSREIVGLTHDV